MPLSLALSHTQIKNKTNKKKHMRFSFKSRSVIWIVKVAQDELVSSYSNLFIFYSNFCNPGAYEQPNIPVTPVMVTLCFQATQLIQILLE